MNRLRYTRTRLTDMNRLISSLLCSFTPATAEEVRLIIMSSPNKCCDLDPMPTVLLKACNYYLTWYYNKYCKCVTEDRYFS